MNKVVNIKDFHAERALTRGLEVWRSHFKDRLTIHSRLADLADETLMSLALLQGESGSVLQEVIMGFLGLGPGIKFNYLPAADKLQVLDVYLFIGDQIRWECMRRLGWVEGFAGEKHPLLDLILNSGRIKREFLPRYPGLTRRHPDYDEYMKRRQFEGEAVVRRLIPESLAAFEKMVKK